MAVPSWMVRHLLFPIHERMVSRETVRLARELEKSQWLAPDDLQTLQRRKLADLLRHVCRHVAFFRDRFRLQGIDPIQMEPFEVLRRMPPLTKDQIRSSIADLLWPGVPGGLFESCTGGSSGDPLVFYLDRRRQAYDQAARVRSHRWFGVNVGDREMLLWGSPIEQQRSDRLKRFRDALFNQRLLDAFHLSARRLDRYLDEWDRFRPTCVFGYPSSLALLVRHARDCGRQLNTERLRAVFVTGEVCLPPDRKDIGAYFAVPVANGYGSREAGFIAHECPQGSMHITAENVIVEILENGRPLDADQVGEIVITHLDMWGMPLIRYRTGDVGRLLPGRCCCGRGLPLMDVVQGRTTDFLYLPNGEVKHALSIIYPLRAMKGVSQFRVMQRGDYSVLVEVVADDRMALVTRAGVERGVRPVLEDLAPLEVRVVNEIAPSPSGKHRYVISHAGAAGRQIGGEGDD